MGPFSSDSQTRTDSSVANIGASDQGVAIYTRGKNATSIAPGGLSIRVGRGGSVEYNVAATTNGATLPGAASYLADAINSQASGAVPNADAQPGAPPGLDKKTILIAAGIALFLFVFLFAAKKL
jgi:hypothetical protein